MKKEYGKIKYQNLISDILDEGENFLPVPGFQDLYATNYGKIIYIRGYHVRKWYKTPGSVHNGKTKPYYRFRIGTKDYCVSRMIYAAWVDNSFPITASYGNELIIDHIDGDTFNNRLENLQLLTQSQNIKKSVMERGGVGKLKCKPCLAYNIITKEYREYACTGDLVDDLWPNNKHNNGQFNMAYTHKSLIRKQWIVGYTKEDIAAAIELNKTRKLHKDVKF